MSASSATSGLAGRYATALFDLAREQDGLDQVAKDLGELQDALADSADLRRLIESPVLSREQQIRAITAIAERAGFAKLTQQFLGLLAHKRRLFALPQVIEAYGALLADHRGEIAAELVSAIPLNEQQVDTIRDKLRASVGKQVQLATRVDPKLLGGLVVRLGSRMIDASLRTKLQQLELAMKGVA